MNNAVDIQQASEELVRLDLVTTGKYTYERLLENLTLRINQLINDNFAALIQLLYTLDISEPKLKALLTNTQNNSAELIAQLIIERQLVKIETRKAFKKAENIPEVEKW